MKTILHLVGALGLGAAIFAGGCASSGGHTQKEAEGPVHAATAEETAALASTTPIDRENVTLFVNGLGCPQCASNIDIQLERVTGVSNIAVNWTAGTVDLSLAGKSRPSPAQLSTAVRRAGFTLVKIQ